MRRSGAEPTISPRSMQSPGRDDRSTESRCFLPEDWEWKERKEQGSRFKKKNLGTSMAVQWLRLPSSAMGSQRVGHDRVTELDCSRSDLNLKRQ